MTIERLQQITPGWEEVLVIGKDIKREESLSHIVGMTRKEEEAVLYILEAEKESEKETALEEKKEPENTNESENTNRRERRFLLKQPTRNPMFLKGVQVGEVTFTTRSADSGALAINPTIEGSLEGLILLYEMKRAGWSLPKGHPFYEKDWEHLLLTRLEFPLEKEIIEKGLPDWEGKEVVLQFDSSAESFLIEEPVRLEIGKEQELEFTLEDGRKGICYINNVYLLDVWKEQEEKFADPRYRERFPEEELEEIKRQFFETLEENCPRGMCYLGIEYECSLEGNLVFYEAAYLNREPEEHKGSASALLLMLRPEQKIGSHGRKLHGCAIQTPLSPDTKQVEAELFQFMENRKAWELVL